MKSQTHGKSTEPLSIQSQPVAAKVRSRTDVICQYFKAPTSLYDRSPQKAAANGIFSFATFFTVRVRVWLCVCVCDCVLCVCVLEINDFQKDFLFKTVRFWHPPKSRKSRIPEPELEINDFQKDFLFKTVRFWHPPKSRKSKIPEPELAINDFQKDFLF